MNQYKVEWSYLGDGNRRIHQVDVFTTFTARDAVREVREEYQNLTDVRIEDVWKDGGVSWDHIDRDWWEE